MTERDLPLAGLRVLDVSQLLAAPINDFAEAFADPQVHHNEMVVTVEHPVGGPIQVVGVPVKLSESPGSVRTAPPLLGEHTSEVLHSLGYGDEDITAFGRNQVI
ncbi:MAG: CoA transferase [Chloroflexi bacterium]|nr:CoA transferase [Chloroflexota bacterium]